MDYIPPEIGQPRPVSPNAVRSLAARAAHTSGVGTKYPNADCPYCKTPVFYDRTRVNGLRPVSGHGCEFCNPL